MTIASLLDKTYAIVRRDLLTSVRYRAGFSIGVLSAIAEMAAFYYLARAVGPGFRPDGVDYYPFLLVGTGFYTFLIMGINSFLTTVQEAQRTGTLEVLMTTATPAPVLVFLSAMSSFAGKTFALFFYLAGGLLLFRVPVRIPNFAGCIAVFVLSVGIAVAIGIVAAAVQIVVQKGSAVVWLLGSAVWFLTGTLFPVNALPKSLQLVSSLIPMTHALTAMRLALLQGAPLTALGVELAILTAFCLLLVPASLLFFAYTLRRARLHGTLSYY
jgi:ABC-2 type transport system permease protein